MRDRNGHPLISGDIVELCFTIDATTPDEERFLDRMPGRVIPEPSDPSECRVCLPGGAVWCGPLASVQHLGVWPSWANTVKTGRPQGTAKRVERVH